MIVVQAVETTSKSNLKDDGRGRTLSQCPERCEVSSMTSSEIIAGDSCISINVRYGCKLSTMFVFAVLTLYLYAGCQEVLYSLWFVCPSDENEEADIRFDQIIKIKQTQ